MTHDSDDTSEVAAAIVALIVARRAASAGATAPPALWRDRTAALRAPLMPGHGSWRASALPR